MVKLHFLHYQWNDVNHIWQFWSFDDCLPSLYILWPVTILFGCHGNIKFKKKGIFNDNSSKTTEALWLWTIFDSYDHLMIVYPLYVFYDQWPFCLVAMAKFFKVAPAGKEDHVKHQQGKKNLLTTCNWNNSSPILSLLIQWRGVCILVKIIDYKKNDPWEQWTHTQRQK